MGILFGNEGQGLDRGVINRCDQKVVIPMQLGTDSLNVMVSAGVTLYHFTNVARTD
jgi:tRNA G18 (ribose-2'-O)-methylase SpoU